jgi:hypothetical protein
LLGLSVSCIRLSVVDRRPARLAMHLTDHDLRQLDRDALSRLGEEAVRRLAERLLADLKDARDRLNQDSRNSSRPVTVHPPTPQIGHQPPRRCLRRDDTARDGLKPERRPSGYDHTECASVFSQHVTEAS